MPGQKNSKIINLNRTFWWQTLACSHKSGSMLLLNTPQQPFSGSILDQHVHVHTNPASNTLTFSQACLYTFSTNICTLCSSRKCPHSYHRRNGTGGGGLHRIRQFKEMYEASLEFQSSGKVGEPYKDPILRGGYGYFLELQIVQ